MDILVLIRTFGALAIVLGLLAGALWAVRRFDLRLPGRVGGQPHRRLELVERLSIDQRRTAVLIRRDDREHLVLLSPEGHVKLESLFSPAAAETATAGAGSFGSMVERETPGLQSKSTRSLARGLDRN